MDPTQQQLAARMNPTPAVISTPQVGLFWDGYDSIYKKNPDGTLVRLGIGDVYPPGSFQNHGAQVAAGADLLQKQYGINLSSLPTINMGDYWQNFVNTMPRSYSIPGGDMQAYMNAYSRTGTIDSFVNQPAAGQTSSTINNQPNSLATGVSPGVQPAVTGSATGVQALQHNGGAAPQGGSQYGTGPGQQNIDPGMGIVDPLVAGIQAPDTGTMPHFAGDFTLIQIRGYPGKTYLLDTKSKTIRPFSSDQAVRNAVPNVTPGDIVEIPSSYVSPGGMLSQDKGYEMLKNEHSIKEDGTFLSLSASAAQLQARYGQKIDQNAEQDAYLLLDGIISSLRDNPNGGFPGSFIDSIKGDKSALAFMISSLAYGGYTPGDVYGDMKRRYLISQGDTSLQNVNPISPTQTRDKYQVTDAGKQALSNPKLTPPAQIGTLDPSVMKLPLFQIPQEAFNTLIPIMNPDTQEYKDAVSKIQDAYHDVLQQQLSATNEREKAIGDANWQTFRENAQSQLGIQLSNNVLDAWTQIQNAHGTFAQQGISGSGLETESIDDYLKRVRSQANQLRTSSQSQTDAQETLYYQKYATSQQIKDLIATDREKARGYGLLPSPEIKNALSFNTLKAKFPNLSDQEINDYINSTLDENGNYRSSINQTYMTNMLTTKQDEQKYREAMVQNNSLLDEAKAYRQFTMPDSPFLRDVSDPKALGVGMAAPTIGDVTAGMLGTPAKYSNIKDVIGGSYNSPVSTGTPPASIPPAVTPPVIIPPPTTPSLDAMKQQLLQGQSTLTRLQNAQAPIQSTPNPYFPQQTNVPASSSSNPTSAYPGLSVMSKASPAITPQQFSAPLKSFNDGTTGTSNAFSMPALQPSRSPGVNYSPTTTPVKPLSSLSAAKPIFGSMGGSTPSTVGGASASKSLSAFQSGLNNVKNFGSNVAGRFKSLFGY